METSSDKVSFSFVILTDDIDNCFTVVKTNTKKLFEKTKSESLNNISILSQGCMGLRSKGIIILDVTKSCTEC